MSGTNRLNPQTLSPFYMVTKLYIIATNSEHCGGEADELI